MTLLLQLIADVWLFIVNLCCHKSTSHINKHFAGSEPEILKGTKFVDSMSRSGIWDFGLKPVINKNEHNYYYLNGRSLETLNEIYDPDSHYDVII